ncbi:hypothetical protein CH254_10045 [Rhodococcus sp. 06-412-2C]|uniref:AAA family ATPase n=1 Tax=unclassified Rhodococcus (in: high G+C Gram-positive bacteria) TaxID=192944 RepID=UPI000B9C575D|nr:MULTISPECIES: AAA family ATPase [unclassified Rhodococcus (in: high G+C Gram-positive bacteria)]OZC89852.1 hypothetical protein CH254_10045 [Rhodococcus sp. 06-412-2C]OZC93315.1 hypothetical protein CH279_24010 [Rhodococcus sp. 06-412-2B]
MDTRQSIDALNDLLSSLILDLYLTSGRGQANVNRLRHRSIEDLFTIKNAKIRDCSPEPEIMDVAYVIAQKEIKRFVSMQGKRELRRVLTAIFWLIRSRSKLEASSSLPEAKWLCSTVIVDKTKHPESIRKFLSNVPARPKNEKVILLTGRNASEWSSRMDEIHEIGNRVIDPDVSLKMQDLETQNSDIASKVSRLASSSEMTIGQIPAYDRRDQSLKLSKVYVCGFRGSPNSVALSFEKNGKPTSVMIWGDNGVGKSTLIDGIEFALQSRVDRSADFNSGLRPKIRNVNVNEAKAEVTLSDGNTLTRSLAQSSDGRDKPSNEPIRPGFRLAPLVIRRADILRFLDTDTLSRGTVFFDYFPDPGEAMGRRPDEELQMLEEERFGLRVSRDDLVSRIGEFYPGHDFRLQDSQQLDRFIDEVILPPKRLRRSMDDPWKTVDTRVVSLIASLRATQERLRQTKKILDKGVENLNPIAYRSQLSRISPALSEISSDLTTSFLRITGASHVASIKTMVAVSGPVSLDVVVDFDNGSSAFPQQVFSEAYKDLVALLFFLAMTKKAADHGQAKILVLDDVLQSVDSTIRLEVMDYVIDEFKGWQLVVTGHDRAWQRQLRSLFQYKGVPVLEKSITQWNFADGIVVGDSTWDILTTLKDAITRGDSQASASAAGIMLEQISDELSWRLGASVTRRRNDSYTLSDTWSGVSSKLKKSQLFNVCVRIEKRIIIRNLLGAHYNSWSESISWLDVQSLAFDVIELHSRVKCQVCGSWISGSRPSPLLCSCTKLCVNWT